MDLGTKDPGPGTPHSFVPILINAMHFCLSFDHYGHGGLLYLHTCCYESVH